MGSRGKKIVLLSGFAVIIVIALTAYGIDRATAAMFRAQHLLSGQSFSAKRYFAALLGRW